MSKKLVTGLSLLVTGQIFAAQANSLSTLELHPFRTAARGVVACYEAAGEEMPRFFDETGACEASDLRPTSIWVRKSDNPSIQLTYQVTQNQDGGASWMRSYEGSVSFKNHLGQICKFDLSVHSTDEDALAEVANLRCRLPDQD